MRYGIREICDVVLRAKSAMKLGNKIYYKDEPVIRFDSLKTSSLEQAATTVYAQGGRGNARLVAWEGEKNVTFTMEDALLTPESFSVLTGARLSEDSSGDLNSTVGGSGYSQYYTTVLEGSKAAIVDTSIDLSELHITGFDESIANDDQIHGGVIWKLPNLQSLNDERDLYTSYQLQIYNKRTNKYIEDYDISVSDITYGVLAKQQGKYGYYHINGSTFAWVCGDTLSAPEEVWLFIGNPSTQWQGSDLATDWAKPKDWVLRLDLYGENVSGIADSKEKLAEQIETNSFEEPEFVNVDDVPITVDHLDYNADEQTGTIYLKTGSIASIGSADTLSGYTHFVPSSLYPYLNQDTDNAELISRLAISSASDLSAPRVISVTNREIEQLYNYNPALLNQSDEQWVILFAIDFQNSSLTEEGTGIGSIAYAKAYETEYDFRAKLGIIDTVYKPQVLVDKAASAPTIHDFDFIEVPSGCVTLNQVKDYINSKISDINWTAPVYISLVDDNGNIMSEPYPLWDTSVVLSSWDFRTAHRYKVDYYRNVPKVKRLEIEPDKFGTNFYLEAATLFRDNKGVDHPAEFVVPNCKVQSNFTLTMASSGDPSTFTFTMDAFPGYVRFKPDKKVLAAVQLLDDGASKSDLVRTQTNHAVAHESLITW